MEPTERFELPTIRFVIWYSVQLSYVGNFGSIAERPPSLYELNRGGFLDAETMLKLGSRRWGRTTNLRIQSALRYQLRHPGTL